MRIHFICRGNILRSIIAETYLKSQNLSGIETISSGTNVDFSIPQEREFFSNTQELLKRRGILPFAKTEPNQLTDERLKSDDIVVIVNQRAYNEAIELVTLPKDTRTWNIIDIGEGTRIVSGDNRHSLEDTIYDELTLAVDDLVSSLNIIRL